MIQPSAPETGPTPEGENTQPIAYRAVRGGLWVLGNSYWTVGFGFLANIFLTRLLTPEVYGEFALATFFFTLLQLRPKLGLNYAYAQHSGTTGEAVATLWTLDVGLGLLSFGITLLAAPVLSSFGYSADVITMLWLMAGMAMVESFLGVVSATLEKNLDFRPGSLIAGVSLPLSYLPAFWLALNGNGQYSLIAQVVAYSAIGTMLGLGYTVRRMRYLFQLRWRFEVGLAKSFLVYGVITGAGNFLASMVAQVDNFLIGTISGSVSLGYYNRAYRTSQWPGLLLNALIGRTALFTYANLKSDPQRLQRTLSMTFWICLTMSIPVALGLFVSAPRFIQFVYGEQWLESAPLLRVLLFAAVFQPIWENAAALFIGVGRPKRLLFIAGLQVTMLVVIGWPVAYYAGALGIAVLVGVVMLVSLGVVHYQLSRLVKIDWIDIFAAPVAAAGLALLTWVIARNLMSAAGWSLWIEILVESVGVALAFFVFLFLLQPKQTNARIHYIAGLVLARQKRDG